MKRKFSSNLLNRLHICGMSAGITNERVLSIYLQDNLIIPLVVNCLTTFFNSVTIVLGKTGARGDIAETVF